MLFVFDTNVLISAAIKADSIPRYAINKAIETGELLYSQATFKELSLLFERPKIKKYTNNVYNMAFLKTILDTWSFVVITNAITECRDPKDNKFLELAVCGKANTIVTGDKDLLILYPFRDINIIVPNDFLNNSL